MHYHGREGDSQIQRDGVAKANGTDPDKSLDPSTSHVKNVVSKFNFKATGGTRGGSAKVYKRRETPKAPLDIVFPVIKGPNDVVMFEDDPAGNKRNALVNSPSKVFGISVPAKRTKGTGDIEEEQQTESNFMAVAENQPRLDQ
jgi:hypothetical protein